MFAKWTVMQDENNERHYFYGPLSDYEEDDYEGMSVVDEKDYRANDIAELFGNELEDYNYHNITTIASDILRSLEKANLSESQKVIIIKDFVDSFAAQHNMKIHEKPSWF